MHKNSRDSKLNLTRFKHESWLMLKLSRAALAASACQAQTSVIVHFSTHDTSSSIPHARNTAARAVEAGINMLPYWSSSDTKWALHIKWKIKPITATFLNRLLCRGPDPPGLVQPLGDMQHRLKLRAALLAHHPHALGLLLALRAGQGQVKAGRHHPEQRFQAP